MRLTTVLRRLIGVTKMYVESTLFRRDGTLVVRVRPTWRRSRCGECGRVGPRYDRRYEREWRHLPWGRHVVVLRYAPWRVECPQCGVRVEQVPWAPSGGRFSEAFEELVAYFAQITDKTQVTRVLGIAWETVGSIVARVVERRLDPERLVGLRRIGIDEFSYKKRHHYLTVVVDHDRGRVVWAGEGRSAEALAPFFEQLGEEGCKAIEMVTVDLSAAYTKAVRERLPDAEIVYDRFHVQRLVSDALDEVRRELVRELASDPDEARALKRTRFVLLMNPWNLSRSQRRKLSELPAKQPAALPRLPAQRDARSGPRLPPTLAGRTSAPSLACLGLSISAPSLRQSSPNHPQASLRDPRLHPNPPDQRRGRRPQQPDPHDRPQSLRLPLPPGSRCDDLPQLRGHPARPASTHS